MSDPIRSETSQYSELGSDFIDVWIALPCAFCGAKPGDLCKTTRGRNRGRTLYSVGNYHGARHNARVLQVAEYQQPSGRIP